MNEAAPEKNLFPIDFSEFYEWDDFSELYEWDDFSEFYEWDDFSELYEWDDFSEFYLNEKNLFPNAWLKSF